MNRSFKMPFWITLVLLLASNAYWAYSTTGDKVAHHEEVASQHEVKNCDEYKKDLNQLIQFIQNAQNKFEAMKMCRRNKIQFLSYEKDDNEILQFHSFDLVYNKAGMLLETNKK